MPVTVKVNGVANSLVHKGSNAVSVATIPDVCKTPSPGGPVPIPYPNISQSITLAKGTTTVKADGGMMIGNKGSEFSLSNGDNPGVAGGVKSSTFMKESTWILYSFDVKMDGQNACRLTDKKFHNHENTVNLGGVVAPPVVIDPSLVAETQEEACDKLEKDNHVPRRDYDAAAKKAGMRRDDFDQIRAYSEKTDVTVSFRQTSEACIDKIGKYPCKPGSCQESTNPITGLTSGNPPPQYTGDYDMHDLFEGGRKVTNSPRQASIARDLNYRMDKTGKKFPRVMHGPQSTFNAYLEQNPDKLTERAKKYLAPGAEKGKPITVFRKGKVYQLETNEDVLNLYKCEGADPPDHWRFQTADGKEWRP